MTATQTNAQQALKEEFEGAWRDGTPVFGCCRRAVAAAVDNADIYGIAPLDATARVRALREAVEAEMPEHLDTHRCCAGHLADLAFDLPDLLAPVNEEPADE
jgi:hypothetical protein